jgi:hypothetical protein
MSLDHVLVDVLVGQRTATLGTPLSTPGVKELEASVPVTFEHHNVLPYELVASSR